MSVVGIIGHPVAHSLSPAFQEAAFRALGIAVTYERWDTTAEELPDRVAALRAPGTLGANVTIPHKQAVIPLLDELDPLAKAIGAVNTIVNHGPIVGYNTDGRGFVESLRREASFEPEGKRFLVLGAGGAARGIVFALVEGGAASVALANRTPERAAELAAAAGPPVRALAPNEWLRGYDCVVNTTSVGMHGGPEPDGVPIDVATIPSGALVADIVYAPSETPLLAAARGRGLPVLEGLPMLIYQGALAFELWTGRPAPVEVMFAAARAALASRQ